MLSHIFSPPKHQAPSKVANTKPKKKKRENGEAVYQQRSVLKQCDRERERRRDGETEKRRHDTMTEKERWGGRE